MSILIGVKRVDLSEVESRTTLRGAWLLVGVFLSLSGALYGQSLDQLQNLGETGPVAVPVGAAASPTSNVERVAQTPDGRAVEPAAVPGAALAPGAAAEENGSAADAPTSEIRDTSHYVDAVRAADADTLFVTDLDNTVMEPPQDLGSDQWFNYFLGRQLRETPDEEEAVRRTLEVYYPIGRATEMRLVESGVPELIRGMQRSGIRVMALTMRRLPMAEPTVKQLNDLNVDLRVSPPFQGKFPVDGLEPAVYDNGILFGNGLSKQRLLVAFLDQLRSKTGYRPRKIIFVDDRKENVEGAQAAAQRLRIPFLGFRYGFQDEKVRSFDPRVSDAELDCFRKTKRLISDEQARRGECLPR